MAEKVLHQPMKSFQKCLSSQIVYPKDSFPSYNPIKKVEVNGSDLPTVSFSPQSLLHYGCKTNQNTTFSLLICLLVAILLPQSIA